MIIGFCFWISSIPLSAWPREIYAVQLPGTFPNMEHQLRFQVFALMSVIYRMAIGQRPRQNYPSSHYDCLRKWSLEYSPPQWLPPKFIYSLALASEEKSYIWLLWERWHLRSLPPLIHVLKAFPMIQRVTLSSSHQPLHSAATEAASGLPLSLSTCGYLQRLLDDRSRLPRTKQYVYSTREAANISANDRINIANDAPWQPDSRNKSLQERSPWRC